MIEVKEERKEERKEGGKEWRKGKGGCFVEIIIR